MNLRTALEDTRILLAPTLRKAVDSLSAPERLVVGYHLGFVDDRGNPIAGEGGKRLRPTVTLLGARAAGVEPSCVVSAAAAVELTHNFSLVHHDIMDRDDTRRHRPTVWALWGEATAILAGDALQVLAFEAVVESGATGGAETIRAARLLTSTTRELIRGQVLDMQFETRPDVSFAQCRDMAGAKTGALLACSAAIGALLGGANEGAVAALTAYGQHLGLAFQIVDDVLGIWGDPAATGKSNHSDLRAKKHTLPLTWALERPGSQALREWWRHGDVEDPTLTRVEGQLEQLGARQWCLDTAHAQVAAAQHALRGAGLHDEPCADLVQLAHFVVERQA